MFHPLHTDLQPPERFTYPFAYEPHPLCLLAAEAVKQHVAASETLLADANRGKMFGVLVCEREGQLGFLAAYSGLLAGRNDWPFFVPPVFDAQQPDGHFKQEERAISAMQADSEREARKERSQTLQRWLFSQYQMLNARGERRDLIHLWGDYYQPRVVKRYPLPPGGTGDCCAPKLLQRAYQLGLRPRCMAEFWWGESPRQEIRHHGAFYPACSGKCKPVLAWMMQGLQVDDNPELEVQQQLTPRIVYEDEVMLVIDKPSGLLSVAGRNSDYSVESLMQQHYPDSHVAHRLDMGTSGLLLVAKNTATYQQLQQQFIRHEVKKRYLALLEPPSTHWQPRPQRGTIRLPLRPDIVNRPRQIVDTDHGKQAITDYEFLSDRLVALCPHTGRTHQLRVHCAHRDGLGRPIEGDTLYGTNPNATAAFSNSNAQRLMLHASEIWFTHPQTGAPMHFILPFPHDKSHLIYNK